MAKKPKIISERGAECGREIKARVASLRRKRFSSDPKSEKFSAELAILERVAQFEFEKYPDGTAPWHLLTWPHMRWDHVYQVITIMESLKQPTGSQVGSDIRLLPFQVMMVLVFLGPEDPETGERLVREGLLTLARKSGKSVFIAMLVTALMVLHPDEYGLNAQEVLVAASDRDQASIIFGMVNMMVMQDRALGISEKFKVTPSRKIMDHRTTLTKLRCVSSDVAGNHGANPSMVIIDEVGNIKAGHAIDYYSVLTSGFAAQKSPLTLLLSTQAPTDTHFFSQMVDRCMRINEGLIEDSKTAGFVFTLPEVDQDGIEFDAYDEKWWYLASPALGTFQSLEDVRDWAKRSRELPELQNQFELLKQNRRISETQAFLTRQIWGRNAHAFDVEDLRGKPCWVGLDLSETTDLVALVLLFEPLVEGGPLPVLPFAWLPGKESLAQRERRDKVPYSTWLRQGHLEVLSGEVLDYAVVARKLVECNEIYDIRACGFDAYRVKYFRKNLLDLGMHLEEKDDPWFRPIRQGFVTQTHTVQRLEELALEGRLAHANHPVLKWCVANTVVERDGAGNRKFSKNHSFGRIDLTVALGLAAHVRADVNAEFVPSIYSDESIEVFM